MIIIKNFTLLLFLYLNLVTNIAATQDLESLDPSSPLVTAVRACVSETHFNLQMAEENDFPASGLYSFGRDIRNTNSVTQVSSPSYEQHLRKDQELLSGAKRKISRVEKIATKTRAKLKTNAAKKMLEKIVTESSFSLSDIEATLVQLSTNLSSNYPKDIIAIELHQRFQNASSNAFSVLINYITPEIVAGSTEEQADFKVLCKDFYKVTSIIDDCTDESLFFDAIRSHLNKCYDFIPPNTNNLIRRTTVLQHINSLGQYIIRITDDGDDLAVNDAVLELTNYYFKALQLWFVDRTHPDMRSYVFNSLSNRLVYFMDCAPNIFQFCEKHSKKEIESEFQKRSWQSWLQSSQSIWVDPKGCISVRLKTQNNQFTVGFLAENPYRLGALDEQILGDRRTEMLKGAYYKGVPLFIPASLDDQNTPYWRTPKQQLLMDNSHGNTL